MVLCVAYPDSNEESSLLHLGLFDVSFFSSQNTNYIQTKGSGLFFRGQIIWEAIMNELLSIGMSKAKQVILLLQFIISYFSGIFITTSTTNTNNIAS